MLCAGGVRGGGEVWCECLGWLFFGECEGECEIVVWDRSQMEVVAMRWKS